MSDNVKVCGLDWKDTTSYSRGDHKREPSCWTARVGVFQVTVVSSHIYYPGIWVGHCEPFFDTKELGARDRDDAMLKALQLIRKPITEAYKALSRLTRSARSK